MGEDTRQTVLRAGVVLAVAAAFLVAYTLRGALIIFFASLVLALALDPLVEGLARRGLTRARASLVLHAALCGILALGVIFVMPMIFGQARVLTTKLPDLLLAVQARLAASGNAFLRHLAAVVPLSSNAEPAAQTFRWFASAWQLVEGVGGAIMSALFLLGLSHAWLCEGDSAVAALSELLPVERRPGAQEMYAATKQKVGAYVRGQMLVCLSASVTAGLLFLSLRVPNALVLGLVCGLGEAVPIFGPLIAGTLAVASALPVSPSLALWVALGSFTNHVLQSYLVLPRVMGRAVGVSPILVLLSLSALASLLGAGGAVLAIPAAAVLQLAFDRVVRAPETA